VISDVRNAYARISRAGIVAKALALASVAALAPVSALLFASDPTIARLSAMVASFISATAIIALTMILRPVLRLALDLETRAKGAHWRGTIPSDHPERLRANVQDILSQIEASSAPRERAITGLRLREELLTEIGRDLNGSTTQALLGLMRVANLDQLLAFDPAAADRMIVTMAKRLHDAVKPGRVVAQVDRDCFAIWFGDTPEQAAAELGAIAYVLGQEIQDEDFTLTPDIQVGSARFPLDAYDGGTLLSRAYVSLARPQRTEQGAIAFFVRSSPEEARQRFTVEQDLRRAIRRGELALDYQPLVDLSIGRVVGAEALLRWRSDAHASISPSTVVRTLEEAGLVHDVGLWTLNTACRQLRAWRDAGVEDLKVAVNVSALQLRDPGLVTAFERTVASHGLSPSNIELELTESATMDDVAYTHTLFERLREIGFSLAIDDFGSGYSSLTYLRRLPFQKLKIDREFVTHVDQRADSRTICKALIDLTAGLELAVLAEGVERFEEVEILRAMGCSTFQGYYFARPLSPEDFFSTVTNPDWMARVQSRVHRERDELRRRLP
jgi:EAL domain-containing protein (putative c-di-GMP-specific phosphodiesterase class I)/GGDEF domain-containing protein